MGFAGLPDFSDMAAITCDNLIVFRAWVTDGILFRELVHVEQYRPLVSSGFHGFGVSVVTDAAATCDVPADAFLAVTSPPLVQHL